MKFVAKLFSTLMVQALLAGRKTQTRRLNGLEDINDEPDMWRFEGIEDGCFIFVSTSPLYIGLDRPAMEFEPPAQVDNVLWVRESFYAYGEWRKVFNSKKQRYTWRFHDLTTDKGLAYHYVADGEPKGLDITDLRDDQPHWYLRPSIFMPKAACRLFYKVKSVKAERLKDITESDAKAEGVESVIADLEKFGARARGMRLYRDYSRNNNSLVDYPSNGFDAAIFSYESLWKSIHGAESWNANPWVWVIQFEPITKPENFK